MIHQRLRLLTLVALVASCTFKFDRVLEGGEIRGHLEIEAADGTHSPAAGVQVVLLGSQLAATTDTGGGFVLRNLATGRYTLRVLRADETGKKQPALQLSQVAIEAGGDKRGARDVGHLTIEALGGIEGAVMRGSTPVPGAHVVLRDLDQRVTTAEGKYRFTKLPAGNYQVYVLDDEGKLFAGAPKEGVPVTVKPRVIGTTALPLQQMILAQGGTVKGHVQANGVDAVGASVVFSGGPTPVTLTTDDKGQYSGTVPAGLYTILARLEGNTDGVLTNFIVDGDQQVPELTLIPLTSPDAPSEPCAQVVGDAPGPCSPNASCTANGNIATCACLSGFDGDGYSCVPPTVGATCADNRGGCDVHATCTDGTDEVTCACATGYTGNGVTCADADECAAQPGPCDANADCTNSAGSFSCECRSGYTGDGFSCTTDFCAASPCDSNATCANGATNATCTCGTGFIGDGATCAPNFGDVASGTTHACALRTDGSIWCWGDNSHGQLGVSGDEALYPRQVGTGYSTLTAGGEHTCALKMDGTLWCWGDNSAGAAGSPPGQAGPARRSTEASSTDISAPTQYGTATWKAIAAGGSHTCGLQNDNSLWCWGNNLAGQVGTGDFSSPQGQQRIDAQHTWSDVSAGGEHTCAVRSDGTLWCWGQNDQGQLGNDSTGSPQSAPVQIGTAADWKSLSAGFDHTCGLRGAAAPYSLWCWGNNTRGAVGAGASGMAPTPQHVGTDQWASVAAGNAFTCGRHTDESLWCWGANDRGQLATGNNTDASTPTTVTGGGQWIDVAACGSHVCALNTAGALWCWGEGTSGVLGNGTSTDATRPTEQPVIKADACLTTQCSTNATCTSVPGQATCTCNLGYSGDGQSCTPLTLTSLQIQPSAPTVSVGATTSLIAKATYSDQSVSTVTSSVVWTSGDTLVATVDATGTLRGISAGMVEITATLGEVTARANATVTTSGATVVGFGLTGVPSQVVGGSVQMEATAYFDDQTNRDVAAEATWSSDHPEIAQVSATGLITGISPGTAVIEALYQGFTASTTVFIVAPVPQTITITPANSNVNVGTPVYFTAIGHYSDGSDADISHLVTWTSSNTAIATFEGAFLQGVSIGVVTITATAGTVSGTTQVTVVSVPLVSIALEPSSPSLGVGMSQAMYAIGTYSDASTQNLNAQVTWSSNNTNVATIGADGVVHALSAGTATITATLGAITGSTQVAVNGNPLVSISVAPANATVMVGGRQLMTATGTYSDNSTANLAGQVVWTVSNPDAATIDPDGTLHAERTGTLTVTATRGAVSGSTTVTIATPEIVSISISSPNGAIPVGAEVAFTVTAHWTDQSTTDVTPEAQWSSSNEALATITAQGVLTAIGSGTVTVTATVASFTATTDVTIQADVIVTSVSLTPLNVTVPMFGTQAFTATVGYSNGTTLPALNGVEWVVLDDAVAIVNRVGRLTALAVGTTEVRATVYGFTGVAFVTVAPAQLVSVSVRPVPSVQVGTTYQMIAEGSYDSGGTGDITSTVTWSSSDETVATVDAGGGLHALQEGSVVITASKDGFSGNTFIRITPAAIVPVSIDITPADTTVIAGHTFRFSATIHFSDGSTVEQAAMDLWGVFNPSVGSFDGTGLFTATQAGTSEVFARSGSVDGYAFVTVVEPTLTSISLTGPTTVQASMKDLIIATGSYDDGSTADVKDSCSWNTSDSHLATVGQDGTFRAYSAGTVEVTCSVGSVTGATTVDITGVAIDVLDMTPANSLMQVGQTRQFTVTALYHDGSTEDVSARVLWHASPADLGTVDQSGLFTALGPGTANIVGEYGVSAAGVLVMIVEPPTVTSVDVEPADNTVPLGTTIQLYATAHMSDGSALNLGPVAAWTSNDPTVAAVDNTGFVQTTGVGVATIQASYGGVSGTASFTVTSPELTQLDVTPDTANLNVGDTFQFQVTGHYTDGTTQDLTDLADWSSSDGESVQVDSTGLVHTFAATTVQIAASYQSLFDFATVTVVVPVPDSITVDPFDFAVPAGLSQQFTATAHYPGGSSKDITESALWTVDNTNLAQFGAPGQLQGLAEGFVTLSATYLGVTGTVSGSILPPVVTGVVVTGSNLSFIVGDSGSFTATATYSDGSSQNVSESATWTSSNPSIASVASGGSLTALAPGNTTVTATMGAFSSSVDVSVTGPTLLYLTLLEEGEHVQIGRNFQFHVIAMYSNSTTQDVTDLVTTTSSDPAIASVAHFTDPVGWFISGQSVGTVTISFTLGSVTDSAIVFVDPIPLTSLAVDPDNGVVETGLTLQLNAAGHYENGSTQNLTSQVAWTVDNEAIATVDAGGLLTGVSVGSVQVTATMGGISDTITINVMPPHVVSIAITPGTPNVPAYVPFQFTATATYSDSTVGDVTEQVTWVVAPEQPVGAFEPSSPGSFVGTQQGWTTIYAFIGDQMLGYNNVYVEAPVLHSITITPPEPINLAPGQSLQLTATGTFEAGPPKDMTTDVIWTSNNPGLATVDMVTGLLQVNPAAPGGTLTVTAEKGPISGTVTVNINP